MALENIVDNTVMSGVKPIAINNNYNHSSIQKIKPEIKVYNFNKSKSIKNIDIEPQKINSNLLDNLKSFFEEKYGNSLDYYSDIKINNVLYKIVDIPKLFFFDVKENLMQKETLFATAISTSSFFLKPKNPNNYSVFGYFTNNNLFKEYKGNKNISELYNSLYNNKFFDEEGLIIFYEPETINNSSDLRDLILNFFLEHSVFFCNNSFYITPIKDQIKNFYELLVPFDNKNINYKK